MVRKRAAAKVDRRGVAGRLAWCLARIVDRGIELRAEDWCIGVPRPEELTVMPNGMVVSARGHLSTSRRTRDHRRRGHDDGCAALGVPICTAEAFIRARDSVGVTPLLSEAFIAAIADVKASEPHWSPDRARDAFTLALGARVTPMRPRQASEPGAASTG